MDDAASSDDGPVEGAHRPTPALGTGRMEAFSDGVFAIAITLLVLEVAIPPDRGSDLWAAVAEQWPTYLAYIVSFSTIGGVWIAHSAITEFLVGVDPILLRINLVLLLVVAFLPVPTQLLAEYLGSAAGERVAVTLYGFALLATRLMVLALWKYGVWRRLVHPDMADEDVAGVSRKLTPSIAGYTVAIAVGLALPLLAVGLYLAVSLYLILPFRSIAGVFRRRGAGA